MADPKNRRKGSHFGSDVSITENGNTWSTRLGVEGRHRLVGSLGQLAYCKSPSREIEVNQIIGEDVRPNQPVHQTENRVPINYIYVAALKFDFPDLDRVSITDITGRALAIADARYLIVNDSSKAGLLGDFAIDGDS